MGLLNDGVLNNLFFQFAAQVQGGKTVFVRL